MKTTKTTKQVKGEMGIMGESCGLLRAIAPGEMERSAGSGGEIGAAGAGGGLEVRGVREWCRTVMCGEKEGSEGSRAGVPPAIWRRRAAAHSVEREGDMGVVLEGVG
jgi:hypothetical protein